MKDDLSRIKQKYGENMMHLCRKLFPTLLETNGLLFSLLANNFAYSKFLYDDIVKNQLEEALKDYINSLVTIKTNKIDTKKTPQELLKEVGYTLYECQSEEDIQQFKKYYQKTEQLCTFKGNRLAKCFVFFAVKDNALKIERKNFLNPDRQDEYGTSVISIQFSKGKINTLSIKNRYNHTVSNPDATFSNNLENIIPGLTKSFEDNYNLNVNQNDHNELDLNGYVKANDGKYYKYNYEINGIYYCPNNIIIDNFKVKKDYESKEKYIIIDYFIVDLVKKEIKLYDSNINDSFLTGLKDITVISVNKNRDKKEKIINVITKTGPAFIEVDATNKIIRYQNDSLENIGNNFLKENKTLEYISLANVQKVGNSFLHNNIKCMDVMMPKLEECGDFFLFANIGLEKLILFNLKKCGDRFLNNNNLLQKIILPNLINSGKYFLYNNNSLENINLPNLQKTDSYFLDKNKKLKIIFLPKLKYVYDCFLSNCQALEIVKLPNIIECGYSFLEKCPNIKTVDMPNIIKVGDLFLTGSLNLKELCLPKLIKVGNNFLKDNNNLEILLLPKLTYAGDNFLFKNLRLKNIDFPNLEYVKNNFLSDNVIINKINMPKLKITGHCFLTSNQKLNKIYFPALVSVGNYFLSNNSLLEEIFFPNLFESGDFFLSKSPYFSTKLPYYEKFENKILLKK